MSDLRQILETGRRALGGYNLDTEQTSAILDELAEAD